MNRWRTAMMLALGLALASCATVDEGSPGGGSGAPDRPLSAAEAACLGPGQTALPRADADERDLDVVAPPKRVRPLLYPQAARDAGASGDVRVRVLVCADGKVLDTRVMMGQPLLDESAVETARAQAFVPGRRGGQAVAAWFDVIVEYRLP